MTPKTPPQYIYISTKPSYPKNIIFSEKPQNVEIQDFGSQKWPEPTYV